MMDSFSFGRKRGRIIMDWILNLSKNCKDTISLWGGQVRFLYETVKYLYTHVYKCPRGLGPIVKVETLGLEFLGSKK